MEWFEFYCQDLLQRIFGKIFLAYISGNLGCGTFMDTIIANITTHLTMTAKSRRKSAKSLGGL
jgi:hypothetical protein